jgi:hypothetical protein
MMSLGEKRRLWLPYALAFGSKPNVYNAPTTDLSGSKTGYWAAAPD